METFRKLHNRKAFTIVELVIVIAVIAILATVLVPTFGDVISSAKDSAAKQEAKNAYTEYMVDVAASGNAASYCVYQADANRFVAIANGSIVGIFDTKEAALEAMVADPTEELVPTGNGKLFVYGAEPATPDKPADDAKKVVDLVMFMGQSNMAGRGNANEAPTVPEGHGYEFRAVSDPTKLYPIIEPFGKNENRGKVTESTKTGSMVSAFVNAYYTARNVPIVAVSCSQGGTGTDFWVPDGDALNEAITRHNAAREWLEDNGYTIANDFMVWCQGETDGGKGMTADVYSTNLKAIIDEMIEEAGIEFCAVVRIGNANGNLSRHAEIIKAQTELCKSYDKAVLVSAKLAGFGADRMKDDYHYYQDAYNEVGVDAGANTAYYVNTGTEPSMYDPQYDNNYPEDDIVSKVELTFDAVNENGIDLSTIGTVENGALTVTSQTNSTNGIKLAKPITISPDQSFTIEFVTSGETGSIILGSGSSTGGFLYFTPQTGPKVRLRFEDKNNQFEAVTESTSEKTHIAVVYDATTKTLSMYQDGSKLDVKGTANSFIDTITFNTLCGGYYGELAGNSNYPYQGTLYYFRYIEQALSVDQFHQE